MIKRLLDILIAGLGLVLLSPLMLLIALWIKSDSPGKVLYWAERVGLNGQSFRMAKFRSMYAGAQRNGPALTLAGDERVTPAGRWLRRYRLDEIPQLWNVLVGQMSLVGPRPEAPVYVARYTPQQRRVLSVKPGMTGPAQLNFKDETKLLAGPDWQERYLDQVMPAKLALDLAYVENQSTWGDIMIMLQTAYRLLFPYTREKQPLLLGRHLLLVDTALIALAYVLSFVLRFDDETFRVEFLKYVGLLLPYLAVKLLVFFIFGLYRRVWQYASVRELLSILGGVTVSSTLISAITLLLWVLPLAGSPVQGFPRSVLGIDWLMTLVLVGGFRFTLRALSEFSPPEEPPVGPSVGPQAIKRTLIVGTDDGVARVAREARRNPRPAYNLVGLITGNQSQVGLAIHGLPVLGGLDELPAVVRERNINEVIIAAPNVGGDFTRQVLQKTRGQAVSIKTLPGYHELIEGNGGLSQARNIQIEDLLRRDPLSTDEGQIFSYLTGHKILVTGAGGSIGSELCRQISRFGPAEVILLGHGENSIFFIHEELQTAFPSIAYTPVISDIRDFGRTTRLLARHQPDIIFHAAAHKHVPLMELNPEEAIVNNVLGTRVLVEAAEALEVPRLVLISSDKAVAPGSMMGASKRLAELIVQAVAQRSRRCYVVVRFGNVLGSRGSVVPIFQKQIAGGGPVTITHPEVTRYFMTIPEAVQLVLQAAVLGSGGEVFVLDMGQPIKILDIARDLIRLSGLQPGTDIAITFTGLRPGEKLHEGLFTPEEKPAPTQHPQIMAIPATCPASAQFWSRVDSLINAAYGGDTHSMKTLLQEIVPDAQF
ncbi:MAG: polysaccharide biosynthesis protein [Anaerolineae bacterium]